MNSRWSRLWRHGHHDGEATRMVNKKALALALGHRLRDGDSGHSSCGADSGFGEADYGGDFDWWWRSGEVRGSRCRSGER